MKKAILAMLLTAASMFGQASQSATIDKPCSAVWSSMIRTAVDNKFRPTVMDKESGVATFAYDGGTVGVPFMWKSQVATQSQFVNNPKKVSWMAIRVDSATFTTQDVDGGCKVSAKIAYATLRRIGLSPDKQWYVAESNGAFETRLLEQIKQ